MPPCTNLLKLNPVKKKDKLASGLELVIGIFFNEVLRAGKRCNRNRY